MKKIYSSQLRLIDRLIERVETSPTSDRIILKTLILTIIISGIWLVISVSNSYSQTLPVGGGSFTEGIIGTPRFVNPTLAVTRTDQDISALVYSGLMKIDQSGDLIPDLAEKITLSEDGLTYNIEIKRGLTFHDDTPLTARDVIFTLQLIQNPDLKSPLRGNWTDVTVEEIGEYELNIILKEPYAPFVENFTVGIMPKHLWQDLPLEQLPFSQLNTEPIGSGPFEIIETNRSTSGLITQYQLKAFTGNQYNVRIEELFLTFLPNEELLQKALEEKRIDATAYATTEQAKSVVQHGYALIEKPLPRTFGIFFNQNKSLPLRDASARKALSTAIDREVIIQDTLNGFGVPISSPIALSKIELESAHHTETGTTTTHTEQATAILKAGGWLQNNLGIWEKTIDSQSVTLSLVIRTGNSPLFESLAQTVAKQWSAVGVEVTIEQFEQTGLAQSVIRPRDFQVLLFGLDNNRSEDLYPFWHSSQQNDPGLNIAQYANITVDKLLEKARQDQDRTSRLATLNEASVIITQENPAIFLFQPTMNYLVSEEIIISETNRIGKPADRFSNIEQWYTSSDSLWPIFQNTKH
jgi:peptide/nickel transport system substrate-binding protein